MITKATHRTVVRFQWRALQAPSLVVIPVGAAAAGAAGSDLEPLLNV
jgi:hypothetical protein